MVLKEKDFEAKLQHEQEERKKEVEKAKEEQLSLINQLNSAKDLVTELGRELSSEKKLCEKLKDQIESLENSLSKAGEDKEALETKLREKLDLVEGLQDRPPCAVGAKAASVGRRLVPQAHGDVLHCPVRRAAVAQVRECRARVR